MSKLQAPDGSYRVTLTDDGPMEIVTGETDRVGLYARDGGYRVTLVGVEGNRVMISDQDAIEVGASTYTFTIVDGVITQIDVV